MFERELQNIEPNNSPQLYDLIRQNIEYQQNQNIKNTLYKQSLVKISLDKDFQNLFQCDNISESGHSQNTAMMVEVSPQIKEICNWLEDSEEFKGMGYVPYASFTKLLQILHQKVQGTIIVVTDYHTLWMEKMEEMARLYQIKWAFLNPYQSKAEKIKVLQLYEMKKIKLFFISPSIFKTQDYLEFHCDLLVVSDLHLYLHSEQLLDVINDKCNPGRYLALYSTYMKQTYLRAGLDFKPINEPSLEDCTFISLKTQSQQKFKALLNYLQKNQTKRTLLIVRDKAQASNISKMLKLKSMTSLNIFECLTQNEMNSFTSPQILNRQNDIQEKVLDVIYKSKNYEITISRYFDALRFANYDCLVFYSFVDVPHFVEFCPGTTHRLILLCEEDYFKIRNQITSEYITHEVLTRTVMKIMEKNKKREPTNSRRFYSDCVDDKMDMYSVSKMFADKNQEKVIRINAFCKSNELSLKCFKRITNGLFKGGIITKDCKLVFEIEIEEQSLLRFRKLFPQAIQIRRKINLLNLSTSAQKPTRTILQELKSEGVNFKITQKALQLKINKSYEDVNWTQLWTLVNKTVTDSSEDLDKSYLVYKECSYGSVELTRRQKSLQRKKEILNFYTFTPDPKHTNLLDSSHRSNLLTSQIEEWIRNSQESTLDQHELILLLQGVECGRVCRWREQPIFGRYRKYRYEDLGTVVQRIYKNKRIKK